MNYTSMKKRKSVSYSKDLEFPIDEVWSVISACLKCHVTFSAGTIRTFSMLCDISVGNFRTLQRPCDISAGSLRTFERPCGIFLVFCFIGVFFKKI